MQLGNALFAIALSAATVSSAMAQERAAARSEAAILADGWALLAKGDAAGATALASQAMARDPFSSAALVLAVEAELTRGGPPAALAAYERWLGSRRLDDAHVLRRIARALLIDAGGAKQPNVTARLAALTALAADGDRDAAATLEQAAFTGRFGETRALASIGSDRAVNILIAQLGSTPGAKGPLIDALAESGSKLAVPHLRALLFDANDLNRASAADALGRMGASEAMPELRPLLNDPVFTVKMKAAGALYRLNDSSGLPLLTELTNSEHGAVRIAAARELASQPDTVWQGMVRNLTNDPDPVVRLDAAKLIAPYDQPLAKSVLDALMRDSNVAIQEEASRIFVERVAADFATLRALMRSGTTAVRVKAAGRILELTR